MIYFNFCRRRWMLCWNILWHERYMFKFIGKFQLFVQWWFFWKWHGLRRLMDFYIYLCIEHNLWNTSNSLNTTIISTCREKVNYVLYGQANILLKAHIHDITSHNYPYPFVFSEIKCKDVTFCHKLMDRNSAWRQ